MSKDRLLSKARRLYGVSDGGASKELKKLEKGQMRLQARVKDDLSEVVILKSNDKIPLSEFMSMDYHGHKLSVVPFIINALYTGWEFFPTCGYSGMGSSEYQLGCFKILLTNAFKTAEDLPYIFCALFGEFVELHSEDYRPENALIDELKFMQGTCLNEHIYSESNSQALDIYLAAFTNTSNFLNVAIDIALLFVSMQLKFSDKDTFFGSVYAYTEDLLAKWEKHCTFSSKSKNLNFDLVNLASMYIYFAWAIDVYKRYFIALDRELKTSKTSKSIKELTESYDLDKLLDKCFKFRCSPLKRYMLGEITTDQFVNERKKRYKTRVSDLESESALCNDSLCCSKRPDEFLMTALKKGYGDACVNYMGASRATWDEVEENEAHIKELQREINDNDKKLKSLTKGIDNREKRIEQLTSKNKELENKLRDYKASDKRSFDMEEENKKLHKKLKEAVVEENRLKAENKRLIKELEAIKTGENNDTDSLEDATEPEIEEVGPEIEEISFEDKLSKLQGVKVLLLGGIGNLDVELNKLGLQVIRVKGVNDPNLNKDVDFGIILSDRVSHTLIKRSKSLFRSKHIPTLYYKGSNKEMLVDLIYEHKMKGEKSNEKVNS